VEQPERAPRSRHRAQRPTWFFPGLASRPLPDRDAFEWLQRLEAAADVVRAELEALSRTREADVHRAQRVLVKQGTWREYGLFQQGRPNVPVVSRCPATAALVRSIPGAMSAGLVYFSALAPRTRILPHCGPTNTRWRCHLGLIVPKGCELRVGGIRRRWREGKCLLFDDSFVHGANNPTDATRAVLIVDVWHPDLTPFERAAVLDCFARREAPAPASAPVGALRAFARAAADE
jgi:aspartyl/asparaginyl beta-hydroxylase (cupin superfamily)